MVIHGMHPFFDGRHSRVNFFVYLPLYCTHLLVQYLDALLVPALQLVHLLALEETSLEVGELLVFRDVGLRCYLVEPVFQDFDLTVLAHACPVEGLELVLDRLFKLDQGLLVPI